MGWVDSHLSTQEERELEEYYAQMLAAVDRDIADSCPVGQCRYVEFVSYSNGAGRAPRRPRVVRLLEYHGIAYPVHDTPRGRLDQIVEQELLSGVTFPPDSSPYGEFLRRFEKAVREQSSHSRKV